LSIRWSRAPVTVARDPSSIFRGAPVSSRRRGQAVYRWRLSRTSPGDGGSFEKLPAHSTPLTPRTRRQVCVFSALVCSNIRSSHPSTHTSASVTSRIWLPVRLRCSRKSTLVLQQKGAKGDSENQRPDTWRDSPLTFAMHEFMTEPLGTCSLSATSLCSSRGGEDATSNLRLNSTVHPDCLQLRARSRIRRFFPRSPKYDSLAVLSA